MPRPMRVRVLDEPGLSRSSFKRVMFSQSLSLLAVDDADEVRKLGDHATHFRGVLEGRLPADLVEAQSDQRCALVLLAADRAPDLLDGDGLIGHWCSPEAGGQASAAASPRRACN